VEKTLKEASDSREKQKFKDKDEFMEMLQADVYPKIE
jgi:hypothetical protein